MTCCFQDVKSQKSFGIHWGTFNLTDEALDEPPQELKQQAKAAELASDDFVALQHGGMIQTSQGKTLNKPAVV